MREDVTVGVIAGLVLIALAWAWAHGTGRQVVL